MQNYIYVERAEACLRRVLYIYNSIVRSTTTSRQARWALRIDHMVGIAIHHKAVRRGGIAIHYKAVRRGGIAN